MLGAGFEPAPPRAGLLGPRRWRGGRFEPVGRGGAVSAMAVVCRGRAAVTVDAVVLVLKIEVLVSGGMFSFSERWFVCSQCFLEFVISITSAPSKYGVFR